MPRPPKQKQPEFIGSGLTQDEIQSGKLRFSEYLKNYPQLNKLSNIQLLEDLVWLECLQDRFKKQVGLVSNPTEGSDGKIKIEAIPRHLQEAITNGLEQIVTVKTKLGLFEDQKTIDAFKYIEELKTKAAKYRQEHPLSFQCKCPHCAKIFFLKRRTDKFEEFKSPFFADDMILKNTPLYRLWKDGKISKDEAAAVLGVSSDYMDWLDEKVYKNGKTKE